MAEPQQQSTQQRSAAGWQIASTAGATGMIAQVLIWVTTSPLPRLDANTATAIAGLTVMTGASLIHAYQLYKCKSNGQSSQT